MKRLALAWLLLAGACAPPRGGAAAELREEAAAAVTGLARDFEKPREASFFRRVDASLFPGYAAFREQVHAFTVENRRILLDILIDQVDEDRGTLSVGATWHRSSADSRGRQTLERGACRLVFRRQPSGGLLLSSIQGASPF